MSNETIIHTTNGICSVEISSHECTDWVCYCELYSLKNTYCTTLFFLFFYLITLWITSLYLLHTFTYLYYTN